MGKLIANYSCADTVSREDLEAEIRVAKSVGTVAFESKCSAHLHGYPEIDRTNFIHTAGTDTVSR